MQFNFVGARKGGEEMGCVGQANRWIGIWNLHWDLGRVSDRMVLDFGLWACKVAMALVRYDWGGFERCEELLTQSQQK